MRAAAIVIQKWVRRFLAQKLKERRKKAALVIRGFIEGWYHSLKLSCGSSGEVYNAWRLVILFFQETK